MSNALSDFVTWAEHRAPDVPPSPRTAHMARAGIGNAVPPDAAQAIAGEMGRTLLLAWSGETFTLSSAPIWVQPALAALTVAQGGSNG